MTANAVFGVLWLIGALLSPMPDRSPTSPMVAMSSTGTASRAVEVDPAMSVVYRPPVDRPISGGFHLESGQYGAGRRGIQYQTIQGDPVRAAAAGIVTFAGAVAGRVSVTISHADGRRSTVTGLIEVSVKVDQIVLGDEMIALAAPGLLLTLREGDTYVDPAQFLTTADQRARLVPTTANPALGGGARSHYTLPSARSEDRALLRIPAEQPLLRGVHPVARGSKQHNHPPGNTLGRVTFIGAAPFPGFV
ncbi:MAG: M23 family metallopeptidase [Microthrixaceae bacterium]